MHILLVNDDGPPSPHSSPYIHSLVRALQASGHVVSVCLPHTQRSWIGKAHMIGQTIKPSYYRPPPASQPAAGLSPADDYNHGSVHPRPTTDPAVEEWVLVDGTPASCVQIGLYHFFKERGPVDLVLSGPNYGRNTTAVFALSSGTLGGALEGAVCGKRAVALSFAFTSRSHDPEVIAQASRHSVRVVEALARQWPDDRSVDVYSVNVPLVDGVEAAKTLWTPVLQNYWGPKSCFAETEASDADGEDEDEEEERIRGGEQAAGRRPSEGGTAGIVHEHRHFKWAPTLADVLKSVENSEPGNDGWVVKENMTSVAPLKANFMQAATSLHGQELQLESPESVNSTEGHKTTQELPIRSKTRSADHLYALINYEDDYVQPLLLSALSALLPKDSYTLLDPPASAATVSLSDLVPSPAAKVLQISQYESIDFDYASAHPAAALVNSYMIRKALIRKHFLSATVDNWVAKNPGSILKTHVKRAEAFEVDYAEFLDDALVESFDLRDSLEKNEERPGSEREWWILKPSMSDRGQGIRLFSTMEELQGIFDGWEEDMPDSDDEDEEDEEEGDGNRDDDGDDDNDDDDEKDGIMTSHLRHFVAQPYIDPPMLLKEMDDRKFHVRVYVLAVGGLKVYVYKHMLALFAGKPYTPPHGAGGREEGDAEEEGEGEGGLDLDAHLTNTCLQGPGARSDSVARFWDLPLPGAAKSGQGGEGGSKKPHDDIFEQICEVTGDIFEAAARTMMVHFQPTENAFEVFGVDFLVDAQGTAWLLEINAFPDFKQTGEDAELREVVAGFWKGVVDVAVGGFVGEPRKEEKDMVLVRCLDLGRKW